MKSAVGNMPVAIKKWQLVNEEDQYRAGVAALLLENQSQWFDQCEKEGLIPAAAVAAKWGDDWREKVYAAIKNAWLKSVLFELVAIQPVNALVGQIAYYQIAHYQLQGYMPEIRLNIATTYIQVESPSYGIVVVPDADLPLDSILDMFFDEQLTSAAREVIGTLLNSANDAGRVCQSSPADLKNTICKAANKVHLDSMRGPANTLVANEKTLSMLGLDLPLSNGRIQKVGVFDGKLNAYRDTLFPDGQVLVWYQGKSPLDTGVIYSPFRTEFRPTNVSGRGYGAVTRQKVSLVRPEFCWVVQL